jgi:kinetochore protein NNF1
VSGEVHVIIVTNSRSRGFGNVYILECDIHYNIIHRRLNSPTNDLTYVLKVKELVMISATMPSRTSASPSPPPSAPTQSIIQPGPRAAALKKIYTSALTSTLKSNSYENFSSCFPTPAKYCPTALEGVYRQLNTRLEAECTKEFEKILEERNVIEGLNHWDDILDQARQRRDRAVDDQRDDSGLHLLSAEDLHAAFLDGYLVKVTGEMHDKLVETQVRNRQIMSNIEKQREEIDRLTSGLEGMVKDIDGAVKVLENHLGEDGSQDLRNDVWDMEQEIKATR